MQVLTPSTETGSENNSHLSDLEFSRLELPEALLKGIEAAGFSRCTPIQAKTLPIALEGHDVAGQKVGAVSKKQLEEFLDPLVGSAES